MSLKTMYIQLLILYIDKLITRLNYLIEHHNDTCVNINNKIHIKTA